MGDETEVVKAWLTPIVPAEVHGFAVTVGIGPYPPDEPHSVERAVYAELIPNTRDTQRKLRRAGKERILGMVPLTHEAALDILEDPEGRLAEHAAATALREAARLARTVEAA